MRKSAVLRIDKYLSINNGVAPFVRKNLRKMNFIKGKLWNILIFSNVKSTVTSARTE